MTAAKRGRNAALMSPLFGMPSRGRRNCGRLRWRSRLELLRDGVLLLARADFSCVRVCVR